MHEYPFSDMSQEKALEYLFLEFAAYKEATDKKIASLEAQLLELRQTMERNSQRVELESMLENTEKEHETPYVKEI